MDSSNFASMLHLAKYGGGGEVGEIADTMLESLRDSEARITELERALKLATDEIFGPAPAQSGEGESNG